MVGKKQIYSFLYISFRFHNKNGLFSFFHSLCWQILFMARCVNTFMRFVKRFLKNKRDHLDVRKEVVIKVLNMVLGCKSQFKAKSKQNLV